MNLFYSNIRKTVLALAIVSSLVFPSVTLAGFGISPPGITEDKLVRGSSLERTIYLVQGNPTEDTNIEVSVDESPIKSWIEVSPGLNFTIPKGVQQFPLVVKINVPKEASIGQYKTYIHVRTVPRLTNEEGAGVSISLGGRIDIDLTVGEGVYYSFKIKNIKLRNIKDDDSPQAEIRIENMGNVPAGPDEATFELYNSLQDVRLAYVQGVKFEKIPAFTSGTLIGKFTLPVKLSPGEYWGVLRLYDDEKLIKEHKEVFNVSQSTIVDRYWPVMAGVLALIILFAIIHFIKRSFRSRR